MTDQTVNIPLLRKAVEWAEAEAAKPLIDREWVQESWYQTPRDRAERMLWEAPESVDSNEHFQLLAAHCGTAHCIAGYIAQSLDERYADDARPDGMPHASEFAAEALGLEDGHPFDARQGHLFYEGNTIEDVRRIAEDIAGERL